MVRVVTVREIRKHDESMLKISVLVTYTYMFFHDKSIILNISKKKKCTSEPYINEQEVQRVHFH